MPLLKNRHFLWSILSCILLGLLAIAPTAISAELPTTTEKDTAVRSITALRPYVSGHGVERPLRSARRRARPGSLNYDSALFLDFDTWVEEHQREEVFCDEDIPWQGTTDRGTRFYSEPCCGSPWQWHFLPDGLFYRSYLAGPLEPRLGGVWFDERGEGNLWDSTLGGRVGILRYGTPGDYGASGWQLDVEGAAFPRLDLDENNDLVSADFRFGVPLTYAQGQWQAKLSYYHLSSHLGDEFLERIPTAVRSNYSRDVIVLGVGYFIVPEIRLYGEAGYAFYTSGPAEPLETQFGVEYAPAYPTGIRGAPFAAVNAQFREDTDWNGTLVAQAGWAVSGDTSRHLFRLGLQYFNGPSNQMQFVTTTEQQFGFGIWYDF